MGEFWDADCFVPTASVEIIVGSSSSLETSIYPSLTNVLACAGLPAHDDWLLDFSEDESLFSGLVDANVHAGTTDNVVKDAGSLVDESLSLGLVTAVMHTETTAHDGGRVAESPASGSLLIWAEVLLSPGPCWACVFRFYALSQLLLLVWALVFQSPDPWICVIRFLPLSQLPLLDWAPVLLSADPWICGILFMPLGRLSLLVWAKSSCP